VTAKRYLYPIGHSRSSLNYRKKAQLAQLFSETDLFFRVKRQIKTVLTNVVAEHVKSHMSNAKQGNCESVVHNKCGTAAIQGEIALGRDWKIQLNASGTSHEARGLGYKIQ